MNDEDNDTQAELAAWELLQEARRERDEARFDLAFRRDLYRIQELQLSELRRKLAEYEIINNKHCNQIQ